MTTFEREIKLGEFKDLANYRSPSVTISVFWRTTGEPGILFDTDPVAWDSPLTETITEDEAEQIETALRDARAECKRLREQERE